MVVQKNTLRSYVPLRFLEASAAAMAIVSVV